MIRRALILAFTMLVAGNSLATAALVVECDSGCGACCSARLDARVSPSKVRCLTECNQPGESQRSAPATLNRTERDNGSSPVPVGLVREYATQTSTFLRSPARSVVQATPIYLRVGTLLI
jgi:hypothetical protein